MYQIFNENKLSDREKWLLKNLRMLGFYKPTSLKELNITDPSILDGLNNETNIDVCRYTPFSWSDVMLTFPTIGRGVK